MHDNLFLNHPTQIPIQLLIQNHQWKKQLAKKIVLLDIQLGLFFLIFNLNLLCHSLSFISKKTYVLLLYESFSNISIKSITSILKILMVSMSFLKLPYPCPSQPSLEAFPWNLSLKYLAATLLSWQIFPSLYIFAFNLPFLCVVLFACLCIMLISDHIYSLSRSYSIWVIFLENMFNLSSSYLGFIHKFYNFTLHPSSKQLMQILNRKVSEIDFY